jgi:hypothetical protein
MRIKRFAAATAFALVTSLSGLALADVAPRCKCEAPGVTEQGGLAAVMAIAGAAALIVTRGRRR